MSHAVSHSRFTLEPIWLSSGPNIGRRGSLKPTALGSLTFTRGKSATAWQPRQPIEPTSALPRATSPAALEASLSGSKAVDFFRRYDVMASTSTAPRARDAGSELLWFFQKRGMVVVGRK